jgi:hypothetical protein
LSKHRLIPCVIGTYYTAHIVLSLLKFFFIDGDELMLVTKVPKPLRNLSTYLCDGMRTFRLRSIQLLVALPRPAAAGFT